MTLRSIQSFFFCWLETILAHSRAGLLCSVLLYLTAALQFRMCSVQTFEYWFKYVFCGGGVLASKCIVIDKFWNSACLCDFVSCRLCVFKYGCEHSSTKHTDMRQTAHSGKIKKCALRLNSLKIQQDFVRALEHHHRNASFFWFTATPSPRSLRGSLDRCYCLHVSLLGPERNWNDGSVIIKWSCTSELNSSEQYFIFCLHPDAAS